MKSFIKNLLVGGMLAGLSVTGFGQEMTLDVADLESQFNNLANDISAELPGNFNFAMDGGTGTIGDGGNDMYDTGNILTSELNNRLPYQAGGLPLQDLSTFYGEGAEGFVGKVGAVFLTAVNNFSANSFFVNGNNGADGGGNVQGGQIPIRLQGIDFSIYYKRVYNAGNDPSINHLILVPENGDARVHSFSNNTDNDNHELRDITTQDRPLPLIYVLFAGAAGAEYGNDRFRAVAEVIANYMSLSGASGHQCRTLSGEVKCWGNNKSGELGYGDTDNRGVMPNQMGNQLARVDLGMNVVTVVTGRAHSCALDANGTVKCWGDNVHGQLGQGDTLNRGDQAGQMGAQLQSVSLAMNVSQLVAGEDHTCAIGDTGQLKCWGLNADGQLGLGDTNNRGDQSGEMGSSLAPIDFAGLTVVKVALGLNHSCALLSDESVRCWGANSAQQLRGQAGNGVGSAAGQMGLNLAEVGLPAGFRPVGVAVGREHSCARSDTGEVWCWGGNKAGQQARHDPNLSLLAPGPAQLGSRQTVVDLQCRGATCCGLMIQGSMKCWGENGNGQLGYGDGDNRGGAVVSQGDQLPFVPWEPLVRITSLHVGGRFVCAGDARGERCWGSNKGGVLGYGDEINRADEPSSLPVTLDFIEL